MSSDTSNSSAIDRSVAEGAVRKALAEAGQEWGRDELSTCPADYNLFETIDSFAVVEFLLYTEAALEAAIGRYVPLADETVLDFEVSPLRRIDSWVSYVHAATGPG